MEGVARARRRLSLRRIEKGFSILFSTHPGRRLVLRSFTPSIADRRSNPQILCSHQTIVLLKPYINTDSIEFSRLYILSFYCVFFELLYKT